MSNFKSSITATQNNDKEKAPSKALLEALKEANKIEKEYKNEKRKGYENVNEMLKAILKD